MGEEKCPVEPLLKDRCIEIMNNANGQVFERNYFELKAMLSLISY